MFFGINCAAGAEERVWRIKLDGAEKSGDAKVGMAHSKIIAVRKGKKGGAEYCALSFCRRKNLFAAAEINKSARYIKRALLFLHCFNAVLCTRIACAVGDVVYRYDYGGQKGEVFGIAVQNERIAEQIKIAVNVAYRQTVFKNGHVPV